MLIVINFSFGLEWFHFRWLKESVIEIGKAASLPWILNHLN